jgi:hypothetical protein
VSDAPPATSASPSGAASSAPEETRAGRLLALVRKLIDYGRELAATLQRDPANRPRHFGTTDIALIIAHITRGLLRARTLEERLVRNAARLNAPSRPRRTSSPHKLHSTPPTEPRCDQNAPPLANLPTPEQIAARARHQPIGAVLADICRDLGILPSHPLWPEIRDLILRHGGNLAALVKEIIAQAGRLVAETWASTYPSPLLPGPQHAGADPPKPRA